MLRLLLLLMLLLRSRPLLGLLDLVMLLVPPLRRSDCGVRDLERLGERERGETLRRADGAGECRAGVGLWERLGDGDAILSDSTRGRVGIVLVGSGPLLLYTGLRLEVQNERRNKEQKIKGLDYISMATHGGEECTL